LNTAPIIPIDTIQCDLMGGLIRQIHIDIESCGRIPGCGDSIVDGPFLESTKICG